MRERKDAYPMALRIRVVSAVERGMSHRQAAQTFEVGQATVYRWVALKRTTGSLEPRPKTSGYPRALDEQGDEMLRKLVEAKPDRTIEELTNLLNRKGWKASTSSVSRALLRLGLTFKKKASEQASGIVRTS